MNQIFTSNYARHAQNPNAFAISRKAPDWYHGEEIQSLAPSWDIIMPYRDGRLGREGYKTQYIELLKSRKLTAKGIVESIPDGAILLCYEAQNEFCHRRVLADWIEKETGFVIPEWQNEKEKKKQGQENLVDSLLDF